MTNAERLRILHKKRKEQHRCVLCGEQDERTLAGRTLCYECSEKQKIYYYKSKRKSKRKREAKMKNLSISEIVRLASAEGLSYGEYIVRHRDDNMI